MLLRERERGRCPACLDFAERAVLYRLRSMTAAEFAAIPDCTEGLEHRLVRAAARAGLAPVTQGQRPKPAPDREPLPGELLQPPLLGGELAV